MTQTTRQHSEPRSIRQTTPVRAVNAPFETPVDITAAAQAHVDPRALTTSNVVALQRTVGNAAVQRLMQRTTTTHVTGVQQRAEVAKADDASAMGEQDALSGSGAGLSLTGAGAPPNDDATLMTPRPNQTGLPNNRKSDIESLYGVSLDSVNVHSNLSRSAQFGALAYAQGRGIHAAQGQEQHLPHEAWHIVQQAQGRVQPKMQLKDMTAANHDERLEHRGDVIGRRMAASFGQAKPQKTRPNPFAYTTRADSAVKAVAQDSNSIVQRKILAFGIGPWGHVGRSGKHNTPANQAALKELRHDRKVNANDALRHWNNEQEAKVAAGVKKLPLHIAHHISDSVVQDEIVKAANAQHKAAPGPAHWGKVQSMIDGIDPAPALAIFGPMALPNFMGTATAAHAKANADLAWAQAAAIPVKGASAAKLTSLANSIANSPMNLHLGDGKTNMSIGRHGDPNTYQPVAGAHPALPRRMTWRTEQMRAKVKAAVFQDRTLPMAGAMGLGTVAGKQAAAFGPMLPKGVAPVNYVHNSGSPNKFAQLV